MTMLEHVEVALSEYLSGFRQRLLADVFCSIGWEDLCCQAVRGPMGAKVRVALDRYPPGGPKGTSMKPCPECGKWAPRYPADLRCPDCQVDREEAAYEERVGHDGGNGLAALLRPIRWRRAFMPEKRQAMEAEPALPAPRRRARRPRQDYWETHTLENGRVVEQRVIYRDEDDDDIPPDWSRVWRARQPKPERHWIADRLDMPADPKPEPIDDLIEALLNRHLDWVRRDSTRRSVGCHQILLLETEEGLQAEIDHYHQTGTLRSRTRKVNPYANELEFPFKPPPATP